MPKPTRIETRTDYCVFSPMTTRWKDNDVYGHINNAVYNAWMDTAVTEYFRQVCGEVARLPAVPVAAETQMTFFTSIAHPASVETGFRVEKIGNSSVRCGVGIFLLDDQQASAWGHMIHVWLDQTSNLAVPIPDDIRTGLTTALLERDPP